MLTIGARVIDADLPVGQAHDAFDQHGMLIDTDLGTRLTTIMGELTDPAPSLTPTPSTMR